MTSVLLPVCSVKNLIIITCKYFFKSMLDEVTKERELFLTSKLVFTFSSPVCAFLLFHEAVLLSLLMLRGKQNNTGNAEGVNYLFLFFFFCFRCSGILLSFPYFLFIVEHSSKILLTSVLYSHILNSHSNVD